MNDLRGFLVVALQVENSIERVQDALKRLYKLAQGGTAVGTGLNTKVGFAEKFADAVAKDTGATSLTNVSSAGPGDVLCAFEGCYEHGLRTFDAVQVIPLKQHRTSSRLWQHMMLS